MPRPWKRLNEYSKSGFNKLKKRCPLSSSDESCDDDLAVADGDLMSVSEPNSSWCQLSVERSECGYDQSERFSERSERCSEPSESRCEPSECCSERSDHRNEQQEKLNHSGTSSSEDDEGSDEGSEYRFIADGLTDEISSSVYTSDSDNGSVNAHLPRNQEILYEGARLTVGESLTLTMSMIERHNMNKAMQLDLLKYAEVHCPPENKCKTTLYTFEKQFAQNEVPLDRHFYCTTCNETVENQKSVCPSCPERSNISYFLIASIIAQIKALFKRPGFRDSLQYERIRRCQNDENYTDIYNGAVYKELCQDDGFLDSPSNISLTMYTDGVRIYSSSKSNIWPVYFIINELPFSIRMRKENVLLGGLWFGDNKPIPNLFLRPLLVNIRELRQGIDVEVPNVVDPLTVKGIVICVTCDLPAKALFYNMKQYNGKFGCQKCKQKGEYLPNERVRVYPMEPLHLRTDDETQQHAQEAFDAEFAVCGVKGLTILRFIVHNYIRAMAVDIMHCVFEGVVKCVLIIWFCAQFSDHPSSIIQYIDLVDQRLKSFTPPSFGQRLPRSIKEHLAYWKAHELKAWLFYYSLPCLKGILKEEYFEHHQLLVLGISLLCQSSITPEQLDIASRALSEYVRRFEVLYYRRNMSNNLHQLLHLSETVRQFGPLWTTSCFPFEDLNGRMKRLVHGSNSAQLQIYSGVSKYLHLASLKDANLVEGRLAYEFCDNLNSKCGRMRRYFVAQSVYIVGKCIEVQDLPPEIADVCQRANINGPRFLCYRRLLKNKVVYSSTQYERSKRTDSSFALYSDEDGISRIGQIRSFLRTTDCLCPALCHCLASNYAIVRPCIMENRFLTAISGTVLSNIHNILQFRNNEEAIDISNLKSVCFYCKVNDVPETYVIEPVNCMELE